MPLIQNPAAAPQQPQAPTAAPQQGQPPVGALPHKRIFGGLTLAYGGETPVQKDWFNLPPWVVMPTAAHVLSVKLSQQQEGGQ